MNKKGRSETETFIGIGIFIIIMVVFISGGVFTTIISSFDSPDFGGFGLLLGFLFIAIIVLTLLKKILEK